MPVQQFDAQAAPNGVNYWGYQPVAWFAPHRAYSSQRRSARAGQRVPRSGEGAAPRRHRSDSRRRVQSHGRRRRDAARRSRSAASTIRPTTCSIRPNPANYIDDTGCGNTINGNEPVVRRMILDCLRHWVEHMHVDGFRFDLAASLSRGEDGEPLAASADPARHRSRSGAGRHQDHRRSLGRRRTVSGGQLRRRSLGACGTGSIATHVRRFVKSDAGTVGQLADSLVGSAQPVSRSRTAAPAAASTSSPPTTASRSTISSPTTTSTTRPTARTTATARTTTSAGTAASRARPTTRQIEALRRRADQEFLHDPAALRRPADAADGRRGPPHAAGQQQRLLPGQRNFLVRLGRLSPATPTCSASPAG